MVEELLKRISECESKSDGCVEKIIHSYPVLTLEEERKLFGLYDFTNEKQYKDIIFKCHLRDVYDTCDDESGYRQDLISEGTILLYEYIDHYDFRMPYTTFKDNLVIRLKFLYNELKEINNKSLDTRMSTYDLACLEENGKNLTENTEEDGKSPAGLEIVPIDREVYLLDAKEVSKIAYEIFKYKPKIKKKNFTPRHDTKHDDMEY